VAAYTRFAANVLRSDWMSVEPRLKSVPFCSCASDCGTPTTFAKLVGA
jgi:hypothetical protein